MGTEKQRLERDLSSVLDATEKIIYVRDVFLIDDYKDSNNRFLALVVSDQGDDSNEISVFIFKRTPDQGSLYSVEIVVPLTKDTKVETDESVHLLTIKETPNSKTIYRFLVKDLDALAEIGEKLTQHLANVRHIPYQSVNKTFYKWIAKYMLHETGKVLLSTSQSSNTLIRQTYYKARMKSLKSTYLKREIINLGVFTWNVNSKIYAELPKVLFDSFPNEFDILFVSFQEVDMSTSAIVANDLTKKKKWDAILTSGLEKTYEKVFSKQFGGIYSALFVRSVHMPFVRKVESESVPVGILGLLGNKGGIGVMLKIWESRYCFINSHLASSLKAVERRNRDFLNIETEMLFGKNRSIYDCDATFWCGDLNYRLSGVSRQHTIELIESYNLGPLLEADQLRQQMEKKLAFSNFREGDIHFIPTYKFDPGTMVYDSSEKQRIPAWCDRILWHAKDYSDVRLTHYDSVDIEPNPSDHMPVVGRFEVLAAMADPEKKAATQNIVFKELSKLDNDRIPEISLSVTTLNFQVGFGQKVSKTLVLTNTGRVWVEYSFVKPAQEPFKKWMRIPEPKGVIMPGQTKRILITVEVNRDTISDVSIDQEKTTDVIVLNIVGGGDRFITIELEYIRSFLGQSLSSLAKMTKPIRSKQPYSGQKNPIPKELWMIFDYMIKNKRIMKSEGLFENWGDEEEVEYIIESLNNFTPLRDGLSAYSISEVLLKFFTNLPSGVIPSKYLKEILDSKNNLPKVKKIVSKLPQVNYNTFLYTLSFLRELLSFKNYNGLDVEKLSEIFFSLLIAIPEGKALTRKQTQKLVALISLLIK